MLALYFILEYITDYGISNVERCIFLLHHFAKSNTAHGVSLCTLSTWHLMKYTLYLYGIVKCQFFPGLLNSCVDRERDKVIDFGQYS